MQEAGTRHMPKKGKTWLDKISFLAHAKEFVLELFPETDILKRVVHGYRSCGSNRRSG